MAAPKDEQVFKQTRMLLRALRSASEKLSNSLKNSGDLEPSVILERKHAIDALAQASFRMENHRRNMHDLKVKYLLLHLGPVETSQIRTVLETFLPKEPTLVDFGHVPWFEVEAAFVAAQIRCPLALQKFHAEFQEEIHMGSNLSNIIPKSSGKSPHP